MRRLFAILAATFALVAGTTAIPAPAPASESTMHADGDGVVGSFWDYHFYAADHEVYAWWAANGQPAVDPADRQWNQAYLSVKTNGDLTDPDGRHYCIQAAIDWRTPHLYYGPAPDHYDARVLRNCRPDSLVTWVIDEEKLNGNCPRDGVVQPCVHPMGRVQFAKIYFGDNALTTDNYRECRAMSGVALDDCLSWDTGSSCHNLDVCRMKIRRIDGTVDTVGSLNPTSWRN